MLQCKAICRSDGTKCWEQEQTYVYGSTPWNVNKKDTRYEQYLVTNGQGIWKNMTIIFNIYNYDFFSNFFLCRSVKK